TLLDRYQNLEQLLGIELVVRVGSRLTSGHGAILLVIRQLGTSCHAPVVRSVALYCRAVDVHSQDQRHGFVRKTQMSKLPQSEIKLTNYSNKRTIIVKKPV